VISVVDACEEVAESAIPFVARPYQLEAIRAFRITVEKGFRRVVIQLPMGCGKTATAAFLARDLAESLAQRTGAVLRVLWLAHRHELLSQPRDAFRRAWPEVGPNPFGLVKSKRNENDRRIVLASIPTLVNRIDDNPGNFFDLVVVDECHHAVADTWRLVVDHFASLSPPPGHDPPLVLGLTATTCRADGVGLDEAFEALAFEMGIQDAVQHGFLASIESRRVVLPELDFSKIEVDHQGDFSQAQLEAELKKAGVARAVAEAVHDHAVGRRSIVFCVSVDQAQRTAEELMALGVSADWLAGVTPDAERDEKLAALKSGELSALCNVYVLTEGFDCPEVDCVVMARPTKSESLYAQCCGRGLRLLDGKESCLIIDVVGAHEFHGLQTAASLTGEKKTAKKERDPTERAGSKLVVCSSMPCRQIMESGAAVWVGLPPKGPAFCPLCSALVEPTQGEHEIKLLERLVEASRNGIGDRDLFARQRADSPFVWVDCGHEIYALSLSQTLGQLVIFRQGPTWVLEHFDRETAKGQAPPELYRNESMSVCLGVAEEWAQQKKAGWQSKRDNPWRSKPASAGMVSAVEKWRVSTEGHTWSQGAALDAITAARCRSKYRSRVR
jgi:superfamily II DNA or RNA helicase